MFTFFIIVIFFLWMSILIGVVLRWGLYLMLCFEGLYFIIWYFFGFINKFKSKVLFLIFFNFYLLLRTFLWEKIIVRFWFFFGVISGLIILWRFFLMVFLMIFFISGLGFFTGISRVFFRCWLYCRVYFFTCFFLYYSLMEVWLRRSYILLLLWIW